MSSAGEVTLLITNPLPGLRVISFNNPRRKNAINRPTYVGLRQAMDDATADDSVNVIVLTGEGEYFSSGNDIGNFNTGGDMAAYLDEGIIQLRRVVHSFVRCHKLLVAVVNGPAIGIAATLPALCDVVYASDTAYFLTPFTSLGLSAEGGSSYTFPRILGPAKAAEMLLLNHRMSAAEAYQYRFVAEVFPVGELRTKLWPRIESWTKLAHQSLRATKRAMRHMDESDLLAAIENEMIVLRGRLESEEAMNAIVEFMGRQRKPKAQL